MPIFDKPKGFAAKFLSKNPLNNGPFDQVEKLDLRKGAKEGATEVTQTVIKKKKVNEKDRDYDTYSQLNPNNPDKD
tara:strand:+ start:1901 stop:2128 length:228 start_codon:yes stop_codon:yes gene_type:complete